MIVNQSRIIKFKKCIFRDDLNNAREVVILIFTGSSFRNLGAAFISETMASQFSAW